MGSYASMLNNTPWPLVLVCISHLTGLEKKCQEKWCPMGDQCLMPNESFQSKKYTLSLRIKGVGTIVGPYGMKKRLTLSLFSGATANSNKVYHIDGSSDDYNNVKEYLNHMTAHQNATNDGIAYGDKFVTEIRHDAPMRGGLRATGAEIFGGISSIAGLLVSIAGTTLSVLSYAGGTAEINYGIIAEITFKQSALAISHDNFEKLNADISTTLTKLRDASNHRDDIDKTDYKTFLMQSQENALEAYNRVELIGFPQIFEWWKPILYMQLTTIRLAALINLQHLEAVKNSTSQGFLTSAKDCLQNARSTSAELIARSQTTLMHWFQKDIESHFDSNNYDTTIIVTKVNDLKAKYEETWDAMLKLV